MIKIGPLVLKYALLAHVAFTLIKSFARVQVIRHTNALSRRVWTSLRPAATWLWGLLLGVEVLEQRAVLTVYKLAGIGVLSAGIVLYVGLFGCKKRK